MSKKFETTERVDEVEPGKPGWKIILSGHPEEFYILDRHLTDVGWTLQMYVDWLRKQYPHRDATLN
jgi:hypothetical protein